MRVADLVEGVAYSDCNTRLVVPVFPVTKGWGTKRVRTKVGGAWEESTVIVQRSTDADPWGSCGPGRGNRRTPVDSEGHQIYDYAADNIRVTYYEADRDGERVEETARPGVMRLRDLVGTWMEYLSLHIADYQVAFDVRAEERRRAALRSEYTRTLTDAGWHSADSTVLGDKQVTNPQSARVGVTEGYVEHRDRGKVVPPVEHYEVRLHVRDQDEFERLLRALATVRRRETARAEKARA